MVIERMTTETVVQGAPSLDAIARDPRLASGLAADVARALLARAVVAQGALITPALATGPTKLADPGPDGPERAARIEEAAELLGMSKDYLYRHWAKLGGYRDDDRRVKFRLGVLQGHMQRRVPRPGQREGR